ncbi:MAG: HD domain-containing protein [Ruminococcaceae bacterium]|nr:HD domain-containing protein [Oscillospiraceae bacterium]
MENKNILMAQKIAAAVSKAGGRTYYVGGYVRDLLMGSENKDVDIEVHGITPQALFEILDAFGERINIGASFGILGLRHYELDISMPRTETATGRGHKDFEIYVDPFLGEEKAAVRRDFTINALMQNVLTGEVLDFFGGKEDLRNKVVRHVSDATYLEDPLRVLRAAQFAARFGFAVAEETTRLSAGAALAALPGERITGELEKALLKADKPSVFFEELRKMRQLSVWFPEVEALIGVPQRADFHPEGDVWNHTMQVLDEAAALRERSAHPLYLMLAALCHDFGKVLVTKEKDGVLHAHNHEVAGLPLAEAFLRRLSKEKKRIAYVLGLTRLHMQPNRLVGEHAHTKAYMKMFDKTPYPQDLLLLSKADYVGRLGEDDRREDMLAAYVPIEKKLGEMLALYQERMRAPYVTGEDLIRAGLKPGKAMGAALEYAHKLRLAGVPKAEQLKQVLGK